MPVSCYVEGHYGLSNVCLGIPAILGSNGIEKVLDIPLNDEEMEKLTASAYKLKEVIKDLGF